MRIKKLMTIHNYCHFYISLHYSKISLIYQVDFIRLNHFKLIIYHIIIKIFLIICLLILSRYFYNQIVHLILKDRFNFIIY